MKPEEQTKLNETLVKVFKLTEEQVSQLYNADGDLTDLSVVVKADENRVAKFNGDKTSQLNRGIKEGAEKVERAIKEKYAVESDLIGVELVESIVAKQVEETSTASTKDISKHPEYIKLESNISKQLKDRDREWEEKLATREAEFNKEAIFGRVSKKALTSLESRKPILPSDPVKAQVWRDTYLNELRAASYQESDDGTPIVLDKEGNVMKDSHGNTVTFDEFEKSISDKYFEYPTAQQRSSSGNQSPSGPPGGGGEPRTKAEALARLKVENITPEDRKKYTELMDNLKD